MLDELKQLEEYGGADGLQLLLLITPFLLPLGHIVFGAIAWFGSGRIAKKVVRDVDFEVAMGEIDPANLYSVGFLVVGLYFFLSYLGGSLGWLHYLALNQAGDALTRGENDLSIYEVVSQMVPCAGGLYFALLSGQFGRRLANS